MRRLPPLRALHAFEAAARLSSMQDAAAELHVTPGAVSRQVRLLEETLGFALFTRGHRSLTPTAEGRELLAAVGEALDGMDETVTRLRGRRARPVLSIRAHPTFALRWLVPRWVGFYDSHPEIELQLTTSLTRADFARDRVDAAVEMGAPEDPGMDGVELTPVEMTPVATPEMAQMLVSPADLARVPLIHSAPRPDDWPRWLQSAGIEDVDDTAGIHFESLNLAFQAAIAGGGVAMGVLALLENELESGRLVRPFAHLRVSTRPFWLVWPRAAAARPALSALIGWLHETGLARGAGR